jgi:hypothetical protein
MSKIEELDNLAIDEHLSNDLKKIQETLDRISLNIDFNSIKQNMDNQLKIIKKISKDGYIIPSNIDTKTQKEIFRCKNKLELEKIYLKFFTTNNKKELKKLKREFYKYDEIKNFRKPYSQAYFNFNHKNYYTSCILLTSLLEGLIRKYISISIKKNNISGDLNLNLNHKYRNKYTLLFQDKTGISKFIENYYLSINEENIDSSNYFNRNVLMHGLEFERYKKIDAIKLFNIIDILNNLLLLENYEVEV